LTITKVEADVRQSTPSQPSWAVTDASGGCGDTPIRLFNLNLDRTVGTGIRRLDDRGVYNPEGHPAEPEVNAEPLGPAFTVSQQEPAQITIDVKACDNYFEFRILITYVVNGTARTMSIRPTDGDYKVVGGKAAKLYLANLGEPEDGTPSLQPAESSMFKECP
jgi:hypothetical protein